VPVDTDHALVRLGAEAGERIVLGENVIVEVQLFSEVA
jgi:hypothetical protein